MSENIPLVSAVLQDDLEKFIELKNDNQLHQSIYSFTIKDLNSDSLPLHTTNVTLLHIAAMADSLEIFAYLISECHLSMAIESSEGYYPIHYACLNSSTEVLSFILSIDPTQAAVLPKVEHHLLSLAVFSGNPQILFLLLQNGAKLSNKANDFRALMDKAISMRHVECLRLLLNALDCYSTDLNVHLSNSESRPLTQAILQNQPQAIPLLIEAGEDPFRNLASQKCAFSIACELGNEEIASLLIQNVNTVPSIACHWACILGSPEVLNSVINLGANPNKELNKRSCAHYIVDRVSSSTAIEMLQILFNANFDFNQVYFGKNILDEFLFSITRPSQVIEWLLEHDAYPCYNFKGYEYAKKFDFGISTTPSLIEKWFSHVVLPEFKKLHPNIKIKKGIKKIDDLEGYIIS